MYVQELCDAMSWITWQVTRISDHTTDYTGNASAKMDFCERLCLMTIELPEAEWGCPRGRQTEMSHEATGRKQGPMICGVSKEQQLAR
jgi:hypothetical protein